MRPGVHLKRSLLAVLTPLETHLITWLNRQRTAIELLAIMIDLRPPLEHNNVLQQAITKADKNRQPVLIRRRFPEQQNRDDGCCEAAPSPMPCSLAFERSPPECSRMAAVTRKVGQQRSDGGVEESSVFAL
jgi:hypothetical protein